MNTTKWVAALSIAATIYLTPQITIAQDSLFIIPRPKVQIAKAGHYIYTTKTEVFASPDFKDAASLLKEHPYLKFDQVSTLKNLKQLPKQGVILIKAAKEDTLATNAYRLEITSHNIVITAHQPQALLNGISTLRQIAYTRTDTKSLPAVWIEDQPAFGYRGLMLDVSRHFLPITFLKKYIDLLSLYKLNTFHWHLTDGAGWRLEIKKYPKLTQFAAWRTDANWKNWWSNGRKYAEMGSPSAFGGYYTAEQAKELISYAAKRGITVIPEIEMPAHSEEVLAAYPNLSCYGLPYKNSEFCIGNEETFTFLQNVLDEVLDIFPSKYIHIGGDEADKTAWKQCPKCQKLIKAHDLKDEHGLQSYAIKRIEAYLTSKGRKLIGWDEILEGGLAPNATVMSWRGEKGGIEAANSGHDVIMTPGSHLYLDSYQTNPIGQPEAIGGYLPLKKVYSYQPIPTEIDPAKQKHVLGVQANVWAEYMPTANQVDYMVFPRVIALSEVAWTSIPQKSWEDFQSRLQKHYRLLQQLNVNYYPPSNSLSILSSFDMLKKLAQVTINSEQFQPEIRYTLDGSTPTSKSSVYKDGISLNQTGIVKAVIFKDQVPAGKVQELTIDLHKAIGKKVTYNNKYSSNYPAQKELNLVNGQTGDLTYGDGQWQGFLGDLDITIDLENPESLQQLKMRFMQLTGPGVYMPANVKIALSADGINFKTIPQVDNDVPDTDASLRFKTFIFDLKGNTARYLRITAKNEKKGFMFTDEVVVY
ncbi:glycoside hydrolase family 20 protein [Pedobacter gandavensis]|uniref:beta-N-acetylhexosaminidase n=1 Tax=Pedobacter gandavensis TaxID=2679963 RepID=A0ABR6ER84_9SPHI|nr:family 20 glycosylhydrolase [Pedobacter gandavensis]MBB2147770.1 family 20 glycosylhydrolase [Pedobacter gandavensis]